MLLTVLKIVHVGLANGIPFAVDGLEADQDGQGVDAVLHTNGNVVVVDLVGQFTVHQVAICDVVAHVFEEHTSVSSTKLSEVRLQDCVPRVECI